MMREAGLAAALIPVAVVARAEVYMTGEQAVHEFFPGVPSAKWRQQQIRLTDAQVREIEKASDVDVRDRALNVFVSPSKDAVFVDRVIGKHEYIALAVGVKADGSVAGIDILEYKETYGGQVRDAAWRNRFHGKTVAAKFKLGDDVPAISGATLSASHVTAGVRRLVHTYDAIKAAL